MEYNPYELMRNCNKLASGKVKMDGIKSAIYEADMMQDIEYGMTFRYEYIKEAIFNDDSYDAIIMFPDYITKYDELPVKTQWQTFDALWVYKWILENVGSFYQISREDIEKYFEDYKSRCLDNGFNLRSYYMKRLNFYRYADESKLPEIFKKFRKFKSDSLSDCEACVINTGAEFALILDDIDLANEIAEPIFNGRKRCSEVPQVTYGNFMLYHCKKGNIDRAMEYASRMYHMLDNPSFLMQIGYLIEVLADANPEKGIECQKKHIRWHEECKNPLYNFHFSAGSYKLFKTLGDGEQAEFYKSFAAEIGEKLDTRNGTDYFAKYLLNL